MSSFRISELASSLLHRNKPLVTTQKEFEFRLIRSQREFRKKIKWKKYYVKNLFEKRKITTTDRKEGNHTNFPPNFESFFFPDVYTSYSKIFIEFATKTYLFLKFNKKSKHLYFNRTKSFSLSIFSTFSY